MTTGVIVVCTYDRPGEVRELGELLSRVGGGRGVLVVDASPDTATEDVCGVFGFVEHVRSERAALAFQRNRGIERAERLGVDVVHFIDDDCRPAPGYFDALEDVLASTDAAGVGGVITNPEPAPRRWLTRLFLLDGPRPGAVLASGWGTPCHRLDGGGDVEWLPGGAMSYRLTAIRGLSFDERLPGPSWTEDRDFSFRLVLCPAARIRHLPSPAGRAGPRRAARGRTAIRHRWVVENRDRGLRRSAFWWSVAGELLIRVVGGTLARGPDRARRWGAARGVLEGVADILRGRVRPERGRRR